MKVMPFEEIHSDADAAMLGTDTSSVLEHESTNVATTYDKSKRALWCEISKHAPVCFTPALLEELAHFMSVHRNLPDFYVLCSGLSGVFSYGGDLEYFVDLIERSDIESLRSYAQLAVELVYQTATNRDRGSITLACIEGTAYGGGFEAALACDYIIAEEEVLFGFPEVKFNLFPGMGAYTLLCRRVPPRLAETIIVSGQTYTAAHLHQLGIVDQIVAKGTARSATEDQVRRLRTTYRGQRAFYSAIEERNKVDRAELLRAADVWVQSALYLEEKDLRIMRFLARSQKKNALHPGVVPVPAEG